MQRIPDFCVRKILKIIQEKEIYLLLLFFVCNFYGFDKFMSSN